MVESVWRIAVVGLVLSATPARAAQPASDLEGVAQGMAQSVHGATSAVGRDAQGQAKWAGVWMEEQQVCDQGRLNPAGQRIVQAGRRYSHEHGARLTLFTPPENAQAVQRDVAGIAPEATVRGNDLIGRHCYLVISK